MEITEDYVSFETAKLLKKKGFNVPVRTFYNPKYRGEKVSKGTALINYNADPEDGSELCSAPTLQMACKWLREKHHIFIQVELYSKRNDYCFDVFKNTHRILIEYLEVCNSYEEAVEAALNYCLNNLIK